MIKSLYLCKPLLKHNSRVFEIKHSHRFRVYSPWRTWWVSSVTRRVVSVWREGLCRQAVKCRSSPLPAVRSPVIAVFVTKCSVVSRFIHREGHDECPPSRWEWYLYDGRVCVDRQSSVDPLPSRLWDPQLSLSLLLSTLLFPGSFTVKDMMSVLRHEESGICMTGGFVSTGSQVSILSPPGCEIPSCRCLCY